MRKTSYIIFIIVLFLDSFTACRETYKSDTPEVSSEAQSISRGIKSLEANDLAAATDSFKQIPPAANLSHWARLYEAEIFEKQGSIQKALNKYREIGGHTAATIDAGIAILRLELKTAISDGSFRERYQTLEKQARLVDRTELLGELQLIEAAAVELQGQVNLAVASLQATREKFIKTAIGNKAREELERLHFSDKEQESIPWLISEAAILTREGELNKALERAQLAKSLTTLGSAAYYETSLSEQDVVKASGRAEEAERLLTIIAKEAPPEIAEKAVYKLIQNTWNKNQNKLALGQIENYYSRFPNGKFRFDINFVQARANEDEENLAEAKVLYQKLISSPIGEDTRARAIKQLAWLYVKLNNNVQAAENFRLGFRINNELLEEVLEKVNKNESGTKSSSVNPLFREIRNYLEEREHHRYWLAQTLSQLNDKEKKLLNFEPESPKTLWREILAAYPQGYYGMLSRLELGEKLSPPTAQKACVDTIPDSLRNLLKDLSLYQLKNLADAEMSWHIASSYPPSFITELQDAIYGESAFRFETLKIALTRAELRLQYSFPERALNTMDSLFRRPEILKPFEVDADSCLQNILNLSFPKPKQEIFSKASIETGLPLPLLYALARTESYFNPEARSTKDARGLMQLLPTTAKTEGWNGEVDLFEPSVNILLGAKHLARLLKKYAGSEELAIAAYNAGQNAVDRFRARNPTNNINAWVEMIGYQETRDYVKKVRLAKERYEFLTQTN